MGMNVEVKIRKNGKEIEIWDSKRVLGSVKEHLRDNYKFGVEYRLNDTQIVEFLDALTEVYDFDDLHEEESGIWGLQYYLYCGWDVIIMRC